MFYNKRHHQNSFLGQTEKNIMALELFTYPWVNFNSKVLYRSIAKRPNFLSIKSLKLFQSKFYIKSNNLSNSIK